jgi:hypothetical protein
MNAAGEDLPSRAPTPVPSDLYRAWLSDNFVATPGAAIFRRDALYESGGFPRDVGPAADYAVYLRLARAGRVFDHGQVVVRYRSHPTSMSQNGPRMLRATLHVLRHEALQLPAGYEGDWRLGRQRWTTLYGLQTIERVLADMRARGPRPSQLAALATVARYCPRLLASRIRSRLTRAVTSHRAPRRSIE